MTTTATIHVHDALGRYEEIDLARKLFELLQANPSNQFLFDSFWHHKTKHDITFNEIGDLRDWLRWIHIVNLIDRERRGRS